MKKMELLKKYPFVYDHNRSSAKLLKYFIDRLDVNFDILVIFIYIFFIYVFGCSANRLIVSVASIP